MLYIQYIEYGLQGYQYRGVGSRDVFITMYSSTDPHIRTLHDIHIPRCMHPLRHHPWIHGSNDTATLLGIHTPCIRVYPL